MNRERIQRVARESYGIEQLRDVQVEAIDAAVEGRDVLAVWATGSGKSAVYQIAATLRPGLSVVVSPLIALQEDQLVRLQEAPDAPEGVVLNSTRGEASRREAWRRMREGEAEFVLLAPEQLAKPEVIAGLAELEVSLLVVDEAHCIASWGHDFRPDYLLLGAVAERLGRPPIVALTATASTPVREEIIERLALAPDAAVLIGDVDRPNITLGVSRHGEDHDKRQAVLAQVTGLTGPGLLYTSTRRDAEWYAAELAARGVRSAAYHGGLPAAERRRVHELFHVDDVDVVVATSAFGMGIDKPHVRFVVHADVPDSIDAYYQELGRAGRDGMPATATLHYRPEDLALRRYFATKPPGEAELRRIVAALGEGARAPADLADAAEVTPRRLTALLTLLVDTAAARLEGGVVALRPDIDPAVAVAAALERAEDRERIDRSRIDMLRAYAETRRCRRQALLGYFGQEPAEPCGNCDTCAGGSAYEDAGAADTAAHGGFAVDDRVQHRVWGEGTVMEVDDDRITVFFESQGYKVLSLAVIAETGVLGR
ncbi:RecQ family ATP-dependent DNA helicase [Microbacterium sp. P05]|uniref:RecQ family ATP-dependent DNA helicase n=1 Tax=Microbacterium sp. P05 TaxID=3366948 RepID=UPI003746FD6E